MSCSPEMLRSRGVPVEVRTRWGVEPDILCPGNDEAIDFAQNILAEVVELFPSRFIHIGGDEAPRDRWKECARCQARIKAEGLRNEAELQTWLNHRLEQFLASKGRRLIGWDEILEGGLTPGAAVMSWRGTDGGLAAAKAGHDVVMSPVTHCYFDYAQTFGASEPEAIGGYLPLRRVYEYEPEPIALPQTQRPHILGAQGNIWTEFIWTPQEVEYFAFPRAAALAEVCWSPVQNRSFKEFRPRLEWHLKRLDQLEVNYRKLDAPLGEWNPDTLTKQDRFTREFGIPPELISKSGRYEVEVVYLKGEKGMYFDGAELVCDGQVIARDLHRGFAGQSPVKSVFTLAVPKTTSRHSHVLRLHFDSSAGIDSWGEILWRALR